MVRTDIQLVLVVKGVIHLRDQLGRIPRFTVSTEVGEHYTFPIDAAGPFLVSKADAAAMEVVLAVARVEFKLIFNIINLEATVGNAVGEAAWRLARTRAVVEIIPRV